MSTGEQNCAKKCLNLSQKIEFLIQVNYLLTEVVDQAEKIGGISEHIQLSLWMTVSKYEYHKFCEPGPKKTFFNSCYL